MNSSPHAVMACQLALAQIMSQFKCCAQVNVELLTASPAANGFYGAKGVSGLIPTAYSLLEQHTWRRLQRAWARSGVSSFTAQRSLLEYTRAGWEFHAKGIWWAAFPDVLASVV